MRYHCSHQSIVDSRLDQWYQEYHHKKPVTDLVSSRYIIDTFFYVNSFLQSIYKVYFVFLQSRFDDLWRKFVTYSGGEQLFGLEVTEYPDIVRIKKELGLLQKLYGLYNAVIDGVSGYYDILWTEMDIEKINSELLDFQNRYINILVY